MSYIEELLDARGIKAKAEAAISEFENHGGHAVSAREATLAGAILQMLEERADEASRAYPGPIEERRIADDTEISVAMSARDWDALGRLLAESVARGDTFGVRMERHRLVKRLAARLVAAGYKTRSERHPEDQT